MYYFYIQFKDKDADIYIVQVGGLTLSQRTSDRMKKLIAAKEKAKRIIVEKLTGVKEDDFEIKLATLGDLLSRATFVDDIAQFTVVTHP